ncbi:MAG: alpha/beta hydrolase [Pirellula sp.]
MRARPCRPFFSACAIPFIVFAVAIAIPCKAVEPLPAIRLWAGDAPGSEGKTSPEKVDEKGVGFTNITNVHQPSIIPYLPDPSKRNGVAVLVIPGGGHRMLCVGHEGDSVARLLAERGFAAFVLKYRLAREEGSTYTIQDHALADTARAIRTIRAHAEEWHVDPNRVGAMGFSAGGELAWQVSSKAFPGAPTASDSIEHMDGRPNFQALIYPGRSVDIQPDASVPPAFLCCSAYDRQDICEGLAEAYLRFKRAKADAELHIYATSGHGFGVKTANHGAIAGWTDRFIEWLASKEFLKR